MTPTTDQSQEIQKKIDKELNFRTLQARYEKQLAQERLEKEEAIKMAQQANSNRNSQIDDDDDDSEPYVDKKRLNKTLNKYGEQAKIQTQTEIQRAVHTALQEERKQNWLKNNNDFYNVLEQHADKFANHDPELAETILSMPEGFERQKLVYKTIKSLGLHKEQPKEPSIQDKIDANRRGPYYQPSNVGTAPYSNQSNFSEQGQKDAYEKMQALKKNLRL